VERDIVLMGQNRGLRNRWDPSYTSRKFSKRGGSEKKTKISKKYRKIALFSSSKGEGSGKNTEK